MKIGLVGYQGSGKSTLFEWLTGVEPDPSLAHVGQSAMAPVPDPRVDALVEIYRPKKIVLASLELFDTPGLARDDEGNAARLARIREVGCLVLVVAAYAGDDPLAELARFEEDLLLADMQIVSGRVQRLRESVKKPRPSREREQAELDALEPLLAALESGRALREIELSDEQQKVIRAFQLFTHKPKLVVVNTADDENQPERFLRPLGQTPAVAVPLGLELELARLGPEEREEMRRDLGLASDRRPEVLQAMLRASGQILFFTASEKEVRSWLLPRGATALDAADSIHSDLARGFIRAETMASADLIRLGSEREVKAQNLLRQEPKDYIVQDGDILHIKFNV